MQVQAGGSSPLELKKAKKRMSATDGRTRSHAAIASAHRACADSSHPGDCDDVRARAHAELARCGSREVCWSAGSAPWAGRHAGRAWRCVLGSLGRRAPQRSGTKRRASAALALNSSLAETCPPPVPDDPAIRKQAGSGPWTPIPFLRDGLEQLRPQF